MDPWNDVSVLPPPVNTCYSKHDITGLLYECKSITKILSNQAPLHQESAILSRFLYKYDKKFRNDLGYCNFKKVSTGLKKFLKLNLLKDIESFVDVIPTNDEYYLPTRQMLEYVLIRLISFSKIMLRICVCSKKAAIFYLDRLKRGDSHWMSLMPYALLSRIWSLSLILFQHSCGWYSKLFSFLENLQPKGLDFLPKSFKLPPNLENLLDLRNLDDVGRFKWSQRKKNDIGFALVESDEIESFNDILNYVNQINNDTKSQEEQELQILPHEILDMSRIPVKTIDHGEVISRDNFKNLVSCNLVQNNSLSPMEKVRMVSNNTLLTEFISDEMLKNPNDYQKSKTEQKLKRKSYGVPEMAGMDIKNIYHDEILRDNIKNIVDSNLDQNETMHRVEMVTNSKSLTEFINQEEELRNSNNKQSLTCHLSFMQWQALKKSLTKLNDLLGSNRKIERKFQKIWKEKCLDYIQ